MKPQNLIITEGFRTFRIDLFIEFLTKKPTCRITCAEDCEDSQDIDGEWIVDHEDASFFVTVEQIDQIISKLQEARSFLQMK